MRARRGEQWRMDTTAVGRQEQSVGEMRSNGQAARTSEEGRTPRRTRVATVATLALGMLTLSVVGATHTADAAPNQITEATFEWAVSDEANTGAFNGSCNFMSAGESDGHVGTYTATDGDATVLKLNAAGNHVPISDYSSRCRDKDGVAVTAAGTRRLGQKVRYENGTGTADPVTGEVSIQWQGTFSNNYYGHLSPFWFKDPHLTVDASGNGRVTATVGGYRSSMDNPDVRELVDPMPGIVIAELRNVGSRNTDGFVVTPVYRGVTYNSNDVPQIRIYDGWGSWPTPFVDAMSNLGLGAYWYTTGGAADSRKPAAPISVGFGPGTAPPTTTTTTVVGGSSTTTTSPTTTTTSPTTTTTSVTTTTTPGSSGGLTIGVDVPETLDNNGENPGGGDGTDGDGDGLPDDVFRWTIDAGQSGVTLSQVASGEGQLRFGGSLSGVTIVDTRNGSPSWSLSGQVSNFSGGLAGKYLGWVPRVISAGGGAVPGGTVSSGLIAGNGLADVSPLASAPAGHAKGSVTVGADLDLLIPSSTPAGSYTATLTLTALG